MGRCARRGSIAAQQESPLPLGPGEVAHTHLGAVAVVGFFGEDAQYQRSFLLLGGPVGLALTGAASMARNASKKAEAQRAGRPALARPRNVPTSS